MNALCAGFARPKWEKFTNVLRARIMCIRFVARRQKVMRKDMDRKCHVLAVQKAIYFKVLYFVQLLKYKQLIELKA